MSTDWGKRRHRYGKQRHGGRGGLLTETSYQRGDDPAAFRTEDPLELELGRERRTAAREARRARGQHVGRPKVLNEKKTALAQRMHASGESASTIATALGVSRATVYRVLAEQTAGGD